MNGYRMMANLLKALAHPIRLQILEVLQAEGEACVCHLEARLGQRQAYISQQLMKLREAGLVIDRREGLNVFYALTHPELGSLIENAKRVTQDLAQKEGIALTIPTLRDVNPEDCRCPKCELKLGLATPLTDKAIR